MLVVDRASGAVEHHRFAELPRLLPPRSLLVVNNSQVVKAALRRTPDDGPYLHIVSPFQATLNNIICLCPWKPAAGSSITVNGGRFGEVPIPIYVNAQREPDAADAIDYQNVYASCPGSVPCPTAGLHLHDDLLSELRRACHDTTVRAAKAEGRPVVAVGTSSVRTLETFASEILSNGPTETL